METAELAKLFTNLNEIAPLSMQVRRLEDKFNQVIELLKSYKQELDPNYEQEQEIESNSITKVWEDEDRMSVSEVCSVLQISRGQLNKLVNKGLLKSYSDTKLIFKAKSIRNYRERHNVQR